MDNAEYDKAVADTVRAAIMASAGSVTEGGKLAGIAYTTLDRKLRGVSSFTVAELRRIAKTAGCKTRDFLPEEEAA